MDPDEVKRHLAYEKQRKENEKRWKIIEQQNEELNKERAKLQKTKQQNIQSINDSNKKIDEYMAAKLKTLQEPRKDRKDYRESENDKPIKTSNSDSIAELQDMLKDLL